VESLCTCCLNKDRCFGGLVHYRQHLADSSPKGLVLYKEIEMRLEYSPWFFLLFPESPQEETFIEEAVNHKKGWFVIKEGKYMSFTMPLERDALISALPKILPNASEYLAKAGIVPYPTRTVVRVNVVLPMAREETP